MQGRTQPRANRQIILRGRIRFSEARREIVSEEQKKHLRNAAFELIAMIDNPESAGPDIRFKAHSIAAKLTEEPEMAGQVRTWHTPPTKTG
jgi:hypothetical protein